MGADGHIKIYDLNKFKKQFKPDQVEVFLELILDSTTYVQELKNEEYLTRYYGDNIISNGLYDVIRFCYNKKEDLILHTSCYYEDWVESYFKNRTTKKQRQIISNMIEFLEIECLLTSWEVWT